MIVPIAVTVAGASPIPAALAVHGLQGVTCTSWTSTTTVLSDERPVFRRSSQPASAGLLARRPPLQRWYSEPTPCLCSFDFQPVSTGFFVGASAEHGVPIDRPGPIA